MTSDAQACSSSIISGEDVRDWRDKRKPLSRAKLAWVGTNPKARLFLKSLRLYVTLWENPHPEKKVTGIDFTSTTTRAAPFCVAMSVEEATVSAKTSDSDRVQGDGNEAVPGKDE